MRNLVICKLDLVTENVITMKCVLSSQAHTVETHETQTHHCHYGLFDLLTCQNVSLCHFFVVVFDDLFLGMFESPGYSCHIFVRHNVDKGKHHG